MRLGLPFENRLVRAALFLGLLGCLGVSVNLLSPTGPNKYFDGFSTNNPLIASACVAEPLPLDSPDVILSGRLEICVPDEFEVAIEVEASVELFQVDTPGCHYRVDRLIITPEVITALDWSQHPATSPPLLV